MIYLLLFGLSGMEWPGFNRHDRSELSTMVLVLVLRSALVVLEHKV